jgi:hypothetical protein
VAVAVAAEAGTIIPATRASLANLAGKKTQQRSTLMEKLLRCFQFLSK